MIKSRLSSKMPIATNDSLTNLTSYSHPRSLSVMQFEERNHSNALALMRTELDKLAQMMRFTIYDGRKDSVSVEEEIAYLENFIELNQIRQQHQIDIRFSKNIADPKQRIPPLLFINLLENAFKHGVETLASQPYIHFSLHTSQQAIAFMIENNFDAQVLAKNKLKRGQGGLGTDNVRRRLALLFPNKHRYQCSANEDRYTAKVEIDLC